MGVTDNMCINPKMISLTDLISPFCTESSAGRNNMLASHITQWRVPNEGEFPVVFSGFESMFADYTLDTTAREHDIKVVAIVHKYDIQLGAVTLGNNPMYTVVYIDLETGELGYFNMHRYTNPTNGFGYENITKPPRCIPGTVIRPDERLYESKANSDGLYKMGVNANVAFITTLDTTEDALVMSESTAKKLQPLGIDNVQLKIDLSKYPLNLYGDSEEFKLFPDIGDRVNPNGVLCGFRRVSDFSAVSDLDKNRLSKINYLYDDLVYAHPNAKIIDIEVHLDGRVNLPSRIYDQVHKYRNARLKYFEEIDKIYEENKNIPITDKFNTLVTRAKGRLLAAKRHVKGIGKRSQVKLVDKISQVGLQIDITLAYDVLVNKGHKSTGREGAKGVIGVIRPDEDMPVDEQGVRADICIDPMSVLKRTNDSQFHEQYLGRVLLFISRRLKTLPDTNSRFSLITEVLNDINPEYCKLVKK